MPRLAGQPWCVAPEALRRYRGPIEVDCAASGAGARDVGSPTGCWWLRAAAGRDIQRLPGKIRIDAPTSGPDEEGLWAPPGDPSPALTAAQAEVWAKTGKILPAEDIPLDRHTYAVS